MSIIWKDGKPYDTLWDMYVDEFEEDFYADPSTAFVKNMREPTPEERQSVAEGIKKISKPTGINFYDYLNKALEEDDELCKEYEALEEEYENLEKRMKYADRAFVLDSEKVDDFLSQSKQDGKKVLERFYAHQPKEGVTTPFKPCKIKNGSKLSIGGTIHTGNLMVDQHFNWFQKLMWKWCFGIKVEDYSEE